MSKTVKTGRRFDRRDRRYIAELICSIYDRRKSDRKDYEDQWEEIDRQLRMEPDATYKLDENNNIDADKAWFPETELPLQAQTLEVLTSDARRMMFPDAGPWFSAHSALTDEYLERVDFTSLIAGDLNDVPSIIDQDNADKLVSGVIMHAHKQYSFYDNIDSINAEAFKYGMGIGRLRLVRKNGKKWPVIVPRSIKNVYLDDSPHHLMNEGYMLRPLVISHKMQRLEDLILAATKGAGDPYNEDGGWMPGNIRDIEGDKHGNVEIIEAEGDIVVPRKTTESLLIQNAIITVVKGSSVDVVRLRFKKYEESSYIEFPYHREQLDTPYSTSPLMKGLPIQRSACMALNYFIISAHLNVLPPISYPADDANYALSRGVPIYPGAQWPSTGSVQTHVFSDPSAMFRAYTGFLQQYADVTGVNAPRLGAQTVSHTTAYAKEAEMSRGTIRTVDYVRQCLKNPLERMLSMEYRMILDNISSSRIYIDEYKSFVDIEKGSLPDDVVFEVHGSGGPAEAQTTMQMRMAALNQALSIDQLRAQYQQMGVEPTIDFEKAIEQVLREGKWTDIDSIIRNEGVFAGVAAGSEVPGAGEVPVAPGAAIQALAEQGFQQF